MNKMFKKLIFVIGLIILTSFGFNAMADEPPPPPTHNTVGDVPAGGGAPVGEGIALMITLAAGYAVRKVKKTGLSLRSR